MKKSKEREKSLKHHVFNSGLTLGTLIENWIFYTFLSFYFSSFYVFIVVPLWKRIWNNEFTYLYFLNRAQSFYLLFKSQRIRKKKMEFKLINRLEKWSYFIWQIVWKKMYLYSVLLIFSSNIQILYFFLCRGRGER